MCEHEEMEMKLLAKTALSLSLLALLALAPAYADQAKAPSGDGAQTVEITRSGSLPSAKGPAEYFTGSVRIDPLFRALDPSRTSGGSVTFEPGARSAWHTHPAGQILVVTAGSGWVQQWDGQTQEIRPGDIVRILPGQKHWHGATATTGMTHIAIQEHVDGKNVDWMEMVSDEQYQAKPVGTD
jgi:quercetin dioxygenase-like cupin family protein